jgi:hypothetical protein
MSPVAALMGLLVVAYFGSMLVGGRAIRGYGLPSGTEFLLLGIFIGPKFMGLLTRSGLASFEPIIVFALTWLSLIVGLHYGVIGDRRVTTRRMLAGLGVATLTLGATSAAAAAFALAATDVRGRDLAILALGCGAVSTETTRHAVRWVTERYGPTGSLSTFVAELSEADDLVPVGALAVLFALVPQSDAITLPLPWWALVLITLAAGGIMGATCAALVDVEPRTSQRWGILLGCGLMAVGTSMRLGLSAVSAAFMMGIVTARLATSRAVLFRMVATTERAVMLPALVLAGACVTLPDLDGFAAVAAGAVTVRLLTKLVVAKVVARAVPATAPASLGLGLMPAGVLTMAVGLACTLRFPGPVGDSVLALAAINVVLGELVGPVMLRRTLRLAREIPDATLTPVPIQPRPRAADRGRRGSRGSRGSIPGADRTSDAGGPR